MSSRDDGRSVSPQMELIRKQHANIMMYFGFFTLTFAIFSFFSDGDFSFLMTYAALTRMFGFGVLVMRMLTKKHARGVSKKTLELYVLTYVFRLISILQHEGYLPYDRSGDFVYHTAEIGALLLALTGVLLMYTRLKSTYEAEADSFGNLHVPSEYGALYLILPCVVLAVFFHPTLNKDFLSDTAWTCSIYMESVAIVPQLFMFQRQERQDEGMVEVLVSHSTFALGFARVMDMIFWMFSYHELADQTGSKTVGMFVLFAQFVHTFIMADFYYYYFLSLKNGKAMQLPGHGGIV